MNNNIKDTVNKPTEGYFKLECLDINGNVIDSFEQKNMIMFNSKPSVANSTIGTYPYIDYINKIVLGDRGHEVSSGNLLIGRDFGYQRDRLFAEEEQGNTYVVVFNPLVRSGDGSISDIKYEAFHEGTSSKTQVLNNKAKVNAKIINVSTIEYTIEIDASNGNGPNGIQPWTEAALYTKREESVEYDNSQSPIGTPKNGKIFAMRTFPAKIKEPTTTLKITWRVIF